MDDAPSAERATALSLSQLHSDAVLMWKSLIQKEQNDGSHWTGLARALEQAGDLETASKCHAKAAALTGGDAPPTVQSVHNPAVVLDETTHGAPVNAVNDFSGTNPSNSDDRDTPASAQSLDVEPSAQNILLSPTPNNDPEPQPQPKPEVDLAKAALDAAQAVSANTPQHTGSRAIANQEVAWFNQGIQLIEGKKYREALSCFDKALPAFAGNDEMIIRILNSRGNAYYLMEEYPKCVESYHQAMLIRPTEVRGDTLYNMGTAYSMMQRYRDAVKCFEQAIPRGLSDEAVRSAKDQIRRCNILQKALDKKKKK